MSSRVQNGSVSVFQGSHPAAFADLSGLITRLMQFSDAIGHGGNDETSFARPER